MSLFQNCSSRREEAHSETGKRMEPRYLGCYGVLKGRRFAAILFSFLLVWAQLWAAPALPTCAKQPAHACCHCGGRMSCCATQPASGSQPVPAVPTSTGSHKLLSISVSTFVAGALPENQVALPGSASWSFLMPDSAPLYARHCARLI